MQSPLGPPSTNDYHYSLGGGDSARRLSASGNYDSSRLVYGDSRSFHQPSHDLSFVSRDGVPSNSYGNVTSPASQLPYQSTHIPGHVHGPPPSPPHVQHSPVSSDGWPSSSPSPPTPSRPLVGGNPLYSAGPATSYNTPSSRNDQYHQNAGYACYAHNPPTLQPPYRSAQGSSGPFGASFGNPTPTLYSDEAAYGAGSHPLQFGYSASPVHATRPARAATPRCEWAHCHLPIDDPSPSGIARHLKQYHDVAVTDNRSRGPCSWGTCGKEMYPSSFGKHIAECHLRNMGRQCPHCGADFARADTLSRHVKAFCPNSQSRG
ncbi:hypothetical protein BD413DRAFT_602051 [Trametes elegans]|nr:hypothetical protein BD413DRAFT_602051 [Trametes elegans]